MILFGEGSLRKAIHEFLEYYHSERNHQGLENRLIMPVGVQPGTHGAIRRKQRLGGLLNFYYRQAA
jgi:putative transposase